MSYINIMCNVCQCRVHGRAKDCFDLDLSLTSLSLINKRLR